MSSSLEQGLLFTVVCRLPLVAASPLVEHRVQVHGFQYLQLEGSVVVATGLGCSTAYGIFPDQGLNLCPLHWQTHSYPLCHLESPLNN